MGFEPTVPMRHNGFRDRPIRPLSHSSGRDASRSDLVRNLEEGLLGSVAGAKNEVRRIPPDPNQATSPEADGAAPSSRTVRFPAKNDDRRAAHSAAPTPPVTSSSWLSRGSVQRLYSVPQAPARGSLAPKTTRRTLAATRAPAHMGHGSRVTTSVTLGEPPAAHGGGGVAQGQDLGVRRRVGGTLTLVVPGGDDVPADQGDRTDGNLSLLGGRPRLGQGERHGVLVAERGPLRGCDAPVCGVRRPRGIPAGRPARSAGRLANAPLTSLKANWSCAAPLAELGEVRRPGRGTAAR